MASALAAAIGGVLAFCSIAGASFTSGGSASMSVTTATLSPPTGVTVAWTPGVGVNWTPTASTRVTGYQVFRANKPGGTYTQIGTVAGASTSATADAPGAGTFFYKLRAYYSANGANWTSGDSNVDSRQDSAFVFAATTAFTSGNCSGSSGGSGTTGNRDMQQGYVPSGSENIFQGASSTGTIAFCSDSFSAGQTMAAGTTTVSAYYTNSAGSGCTVTAKLYYDRSNTLTQLGTGNLSVPQNTTTATLKTWAFATSAVTFQAGDRLVLTLLYVTGKSCTSTALHFDGGSVPSKVIVPSIDGYAATVVANANAIGYWRLDEGSGTVADDSISTHDGTYNGTVTLASTSLLSHDGDASATFDGTTSEFVNIPANAVFNTASFSVAAWVRPTQLRVQGIVDKSSYASSWRLFMDDAGGHFEFDALGDAVNLVSTSTAAAGSPSFVVATYNSSTQTATLYVNGAVDRTTTGVASMGGTSNTALQISSAETNRFNGAIDDVAYFNTALSASQVQALYDSR